MEIIGVKARVGFWEDQYKLGSMLALVEHVATTSSVGSIAERTPAKASHPKDF